MRYNNQFVPEANKMFLRIEKKTQVDSGQFQVTQGSIFD